MNELFKKEHNPKQFVLSTTSGAGESGATVLRCLCVIVSRELILVKAISDSKHFSASHFHEFRLNVGK
jgi:hypothetical protein